MNNKEKLVADLIKDGVVSGDSSWSEIAAMIKRIYFVGSTYIATEDESEPRYYEHSKLYFIDGYRWIKSRKTFSTVRLGHSCYHYELASTDYQKFMQENGKLPEKVS